jgi:hypothetical protein
MKPLPATITPTLAKLIVMLSSDRDGEILATVAAIGRVLAANRVDWHDFAAAMLSPIEDWHELISFCLLHSSQLTPK